MMATSKQQDTNSKSQTARQHSQIPHEQVLSQKFDQLSPFKNNQKEKQRSTDIIQPQTTVSTTKFILSKAVGINFDIVPDYLSTTNQSFEKKIHCILPSTINLEELRKIAILIHNIMSIEIVRSLWIVYRKSGTGELQSTFPINQLDSKIWPMEVQSHMKISKFQPHSNDDNPYLAFVNYCLQQLDDKNKDYRKQLNVKTSHLVGYTHSLEYNIEKFVQQALITKRIEIDCIIAQVQYHYTDILLKRAYLAQNPNEYQIKIVKHLCKLKYDQEMTKHEANFFKQQIPIHIASHPFEKESIAQLSLLDEIQDSAIRQQLYKEYKETAEQGRIKMMNIYLECADGQRDRCHLQFNIESKQMWDTEKGLPTEQQLTPSMRNLLDQRLANITARIECLYKFKIQLF